MKKIILMTMLMGAVFAQSDCNEENWEDYYNSEGNDMTDCDLAGAGFYNANLERALLIGADLEGASLWRPNLGGANLVGANLKGAFFDGGYLAGADLRNANLEGADLRGVKLQYADLRGANLEGVRSSRIEGSIYLLPKGWSLVDGRLIKKDGE